MDPAPQQIRVPPHNRYEFMDPTKQMLPNRYEFMDPALPRVTMEVLKAWWRESARLEEFRCVDTGALLDHVPSAGEHKAPKKKKLTGEELFKTDPKLAGLCGGQAAAGGEDGEGMSLAELKNRERDNGSDEEEEGAGGKKFIKAWGTGPSSLDEEPSSGSAGPAGGGGPVRLEDVEVDQSIFAAAVDDLPDDLDELDDD